MSQNAKVLVVIDVQNDYFPGGLFPLWNTEETLMAVEAAIKQAKSLSIPVVLVQHLADAAAGAAPFFNQGTLGADLHPRVVGAAPDAPVVVKTHADGFVGTTLEAVLDGLGAKHLLVCGMMTQNCVTHTAISRSAEKYRVTMLGDCCTTVSAMLHAIALRAVSTRLTVASALEALEG